ncbi:MAG: 7-cyano-7-deazaguanine synthase QueC [Chloroflexi bacterium]|nr:7-cyano-7-deazaguanine synthase QueC [Chloroflexota bacterium]
MRAVVLLSGGLDSAVCAVLATEEFGANVVAAVNIMFGQKHARESAAAEAVAHELGMGEFKTLELPRDVFEGSGSSLTDSDVPVPEEPYPETVGPVSTYVPFRNGALLSIATAYALKVGAEAVYFGAHKEDGLNWAYPDCTPEFLGAMKNAIWTGTYHKVRLVSPLEWLDKAGVVRLGAERGVPFQLTYSCYRGGEEACGRCATCRSRLAAFSANGLVDPIRYRAIEEV